MINLTSFQSISDYRCEVGIIASSPSTDSGGGSSGIHPIDFGSNRMGIRDGFKCEVGTVGGGSTTAPYGKKEGGPGIGGGGIGHTPSNPQEDESGGSDSGVNSGGGSTGGIFGDGNMKALNEYRCEVGIVGGGSSTGECGVKRGGIEGGGKETSTSISGGGVGPKPQPEDIDGSVAPLDSVS